MSVSCITVERSLGTDYRRSSLRLGELEKALDAGVLDLQLDDWVAAALTEERQDHPHFPHRTRPPFPERDLYDKGAMTQHAAASGWPIPKIFSAPDASGDYLYAMGAQYAPSGGRLHETGTIKINSVRVFGQTLGWRWVVADASLR